MARRRGMVTEEQYRKTKENIFEFCYYMNFQPTWQQEEVLQSVQNAQDGTGSNWIAVRSGQGPGKTTVSVFIGLWRLWRAHKSRTIITAPTMRQCREVWMVEARKRIDAADPVIANRFKVTKTKIEIANDSDWGVTLVTATREENAQGFHNENMTVIVEEASGVPRPIITQFKGTLSNSDALFIQIGNPNQRDCDFFSCFTANRERWKTHVFNAEDTARDYPHIVSPQRNADIEREFGRDSDVYRVRVLGEFPHSDPRCVISLEDAEACTDIKLKVPCARIVRDDGRPAKQFGIDYARFGGDESVLFRRSGQSVVEWERFAHTEPSDVVRKTFRMQVEAGWSDEDTWYVSDAGGMGQGIMHMFYDARKNNVEFHNAGKSPAPDYANKITYAWFRLARLMRERKCYIPRDPMLLQQLTTRQYFTNKDGKLILESKDDYIKRGHEHSPDRAEALAMCFFDDAIIGAQVSGPVTSSRRTA